jgi:hypothetical protein
MSKNAATISALYEDLEHYLDLAEKAIRDKEMDLHMVFGAQFHRTAERIRHITGVDPRSPF